MGVSSLLSHDVAKRRDKRNVQQKGGDRTAGNGAVGATDWEQESETSDRRGITEGTVPQQTARDTASRREAGQSVKGSQVLMDLPFWDECFSTSPLYSKPSADWNKKGKNVSRPEDQAGSHAPSPRAGALLSLLCCNTQACGHPSAGTGLLSLSHHSALHVLSSPLRTGSRKSPCAPGKRATILTSHLLSRRGGWAASDTKMCTGGTPSCCPHPVPPWPVTVHGTAWESGDAKHHSPPRQTQCCLDRTVQAH